MPYQPEPYQPTHLAQDMVLSMELRRKGGRAAARRLGKARKRAFPTSGSAVDYSEWWARSKGRFVNTAKLATAVMATHYDWLLEQLDQAVDQLQQLQIKVTSQEKMITSLTHQLQMKGVSKKKKITLLKYQLQGQEEQIEQLNEALKESQSKFKVEMRFKDDQMKSLEKELMEQMKENRIVSKKLKTSHANFKNSLDLHSEPIIQLLNDLPDLKQNHSNHKFWKKIMELNTIGVDAYCLFKLIQAKCPKGAWQTVMGYREYELCLIDSSSSVSQEEQLQRFRKVVTTALGSGMTQYHVYQSCKQRAGETFEDYSKKKFKLYCAYGVDYKEPDINDQQFLHDVLQTAHKKYQDLDFHNFTSYDCMLSIVDLTDRLLMKRCENCGIRGHDWDSCRRPGGGDEAPPGVCYTCGRYGHLCRDCKR